MRGVPFVVLLVLFFLSQPLRSFSQWNPDAGLIQPLSSGAVTTASSSGAAASKVIDGNEQTAWQSAGTLPNLYIARSDLNIFLRATASGICNNSSNANCKNITDGNLSSSSTFAVAGNRAWVEVGLAQPSPLRNVSMKTYGTDTVFAWIFLSNQDSVRIGYSAPATNYAVLRFPYVTTGFTKIKIVSKKSFALYEVAALAGYPTEYVTIDLGSTKSIGTIVTRHWSGTASYAISTELLVSNDNVNWLLVANLNPDALLAVTTEINPPVNGRYVRVQHTIVEVDYAKVSIWEAKVFDEYGQYGPMPQAVQSNITMSEMLGVNGIWGWGHNMFSNSIPQGQGPTKFKEVASHARNYHNLHWDVSDPDSIPDYENMPFSLAIWWLDWDREYQAWKDAGLKVGATIQYNNNTVNATKWNNPYQAAYNYAYAFARHFGPTYGNGLIDFFEAGNEPWDYPASFYNQIQSGMLHGANDGDSALFVLPCALQADNPGKETATGGNYMGARLLEQDAPYIDGINVHHYSYTQNQDGIRIAVQPESKESELRGIMNDLRFRNTNLPGKKIYVTEWGWDSDGAGESCTFGECVSENEQALYGVRGALMLLRLGIDRASWYFYGNQNSGNLYSRCGMENTAHQNKKSFYAFQALINKLGDKYFIEAIREDDEAWVYLFGDSSGNPTHVAAWRPVKGDDSSFVWIDIPSYLPDSAWTITGASSTGEYAPANVSHNAASIKCRISSAPIIIKLSTSTEIQDCAGVANGTAAPDDCGICSGGTTGHIANSDKDCNGVCFGTATLDCNGDCNGTAFPDDCGICSGGNTGHVPNSNKDCNGICFGTATLDLCGVCNGDNSSCKDCNGDLFGTAFLDDCGICSGGNSGHVANSNKDCNGVCFGTATFDACGVCNGNNSSCADCNGVISGTAFLDDCGICSGGNSGHVANSNKDCNGVCFGTATIDCNGACNGTAFIDDCGICSGGNTGHVPNSNKDCNGVCFGTATLDLCGVCNGDNSSCRDCNGDLFGTAFLDDCGICSGGNSGHVANSNKDCSGICFGISVRDCNGDCNGTALLDDCGICSGGNSGHVPNSNKDCNGVCFGTATLDLCGVCNGNNTSCKDCNGDLFGTAFLDDCGICSGGNSGHLANSDKDCNGVCFGTTIVDCNGDCNGTALLDDCGICSGGNTGRVLNSNKDCNGDCNGTAFLDDCGICSGGNARHSPNSNKDCNGVCFGTATLDLCGVCNGDNSSCRDCNGDLFGTAFLDDCGICSGGNTGHVANSNKDCSGICFGISVRDCNGDCNGTALLDDCGICSGGNSGHVANSNKDCNGVCFGTTIVDCNGDCNGTAFIDDCGICSGGNTGRVPGQKLTFFRDADNDGYGNPFASLQACSAPAGYVTNNTDCNDNNTNVNPGMTEVCGNSVDENCDGLAATIPATPGSINGPGSVCKGSTGVVYSIAPVSGATQYSWTSTSSGATIISGQGTTTITVNFSSNFFSTTLRVSARNTCGTSSQRSLSVSSLSAPSMPGPISGPGNVCANQTNITYSVSAVSGATSYNWTFPAGVSIVSGQGTRTVVVNWGSTSGQISVVAINSNQCRSAPRTKTVSSSACKTDGPAAQIPEETNEEQTHFAPDTHSITYLNSYPNPFDEQLNIEFSLPEDSKVKVEIFSITGQRLSLLFEGDIKATELKKLEYYPLANCPAEPGMLIYRLQTSYGFYYGKAIMVK